MIVITTNGSRRWRGNPGKCPDCGGTGWKHSFLGPQSKFREVCWTCMPYGHLCPDCSKSHNGPCSKPFMRARI